MHGTVGIQSETIFLRCIYKVACGIGGLRGGRAGGTGEWGFDSAWDGMVWEWEWEWMGWCGVRVEGRRIGWMGLGK